MTQSTRKTDGSAARDALRALIHQNLPRALGGYLRGLARISVLGPSLAALPAASGCAASHFPPPSSLTTPTCEASAWQAAAGLTTPTPHAHLGVYASFPAGPLPAATVVLIDEVGTACTGAADATACATAVAAAHPPSPRHVLTTDGDTVAAYTDPAAYAALFGDIDTPQEALLRAWLDGFDVTCGDGTRSGARAVPGGFEVVATRSSGGCSEPLVTTRVLLSVTADGAVTELESEVLSSEVGQCAGRRTEGLNRPPGPPRGGLGAAEEYAAWLARVAHLEEGSIHAFERLADELAAHGAPTALVTAARASARDEARHTEAMSALARASGATPRPATLEASGVRSLFAIALENAVEGCVRETFGALVGHHQALAAEHEELRVAMASIAEDETRHAALSWEVAAWLAPRLSASELAEIQTAQRDAVEAMRREALAGPPVSFGAHAGLPSPQTAARLIDQLHDTLWS